MPNSYSIIPLLMPSRRTKRNSLCANRHAENVTFEEDALRLW